MIIKQLNRFIWPRIIPHQQLENLLNVEDYVQQQQHLAAKILQEAQLHATNIATELTTKTLAELQAANLELLTASEAKLDKLLAELQQNLHAVVLQVLNKCGAFTSETLAVKEVLSTELARFYDLGRLTIRAHSQTLTQFNRDVSSDKIIFETDDSLDPKSCICETNWWIMNLSVAAVQQKILEFLTATATS